MTVTLQPAGQPPIQQATMTVVCNIPQLPKLTGKDEGVTLDKLDGLTFLPFGVGSTQFFSPGDEDDED